MSRSQNRNSTMSKMSTVKIIIRGTPAIILHNIPKNALIQFSAYARSHFTANPEDDRLYLPSTTPKQVAENVLTWICRASPIPTDELPSAPLFSWNVALYTTALQLQICPRGLQNVAQAIQHHLNHLELDATDVAALEMLYSSEIEGERFAEVDRTVVEAFCTRFGALDLREYPALEARMPRERSAIWAEG